jgi:ribosomal protein L18
LTLPTGPALLVLPEAAAEGGEQLNSRAGEQEKKNWVLDREASEQPSRIFAALRKAETASVAGAATAKRD